MAPTTPVAGYRNMYSRDPVTGLLYGIGVAPPPSPFQAQDVEPVPAGQDFIWGDTSQVSPVGSGAFPIDQLSDVDTSTVAPLDGDSLIWDATAGQWKPVTAGAVVAAIDDLSDVDTTTTVPAAGNVLTWDATLSQWKPGVSFGASSNIGVTYTSGWTNAAQNSQGNGGGMQFRVNPAMVSLFMGVANPAGVSGNAASKVCGYPSGVPAPWNRLVFLGLSWSGNLDLSDTVSLEARSDGIYVLGGTMGYTANHYLWATVTWAR